MPGALMSSPRSAVLNVKLPKLEEWISKRTSIAERYRNTEHESLLNQLLTQPILAVDVQAEWQGLVTQLKTRLDPQKALLDRIARGELDLASLRKQRDKDSSY